MRATLPGVPCCAFSFFQACDGDTGWRLDGDEGQVASLLLLGFPGVALGGLITRPSSLSLVAPGLQLRQFPMAF